MNKLVLGTIGLILLAGFVAADNFQTHFPGGEFIGFGQMASHDYIWTGGVFGSTIIGNATYTSPTASGQTGTWEYDYDNGTIATGALN